MDQATGTILFAKNPDLVIPPASLTKLVTLHVVYQEIEAGRLHEQDIVDIDKRDCSPYIPYGSSLMYLRPGMRVSVLDLMQGAAVVSGNDAAFALARRISGSIEAFVVRMNQAVLELGLTDLHFVEPSGLSELNHVTARSFAEFCRIYLELHPQALSELHSLHYIEFPRPEHFTDDYHPTGRIIQYNRNNLVLSYPGCDGLKTGYIIESGYNLAATAARGDTRFVIVTLGGTGESSPLGGTAQRSHDGVALLDWAFASFVTLKPDLGPLPSPRAWYGSSSRAALAPSSDLAVTLPRSLASFLVARVDAPRYLDAPLAKGDRLGEVVYSANGQVLRRVDLVSASALPRGNVFILVKDFFARFFTLLFGG
jgi:D-alanyl-D-alanine carboxypeptidase (penicillin-binding protein 5/6)